MTDEDEGSVDLNANATELVKDDGKENVLCMDEKVLNKKLHDKLKEIVGTAEDIRLRQQVFTIMSAVNGLGDDDSISISSGSLPEGLDIKGSDEDKMIILKYVDVVPMELNPYTSENCTKLTMEMDDDHPGYARLFLNEEKCDNQIVRDSLDIFEGRRLVSSSKFRNQFIEPGIEEHGPCITDGDIDFALSVQGTYWPKVITDRLNNTHSKRWLSNKVMKNLLPDGCVYVPIGPKKSTKYATLWRVSFAKSERKLVLEMNYTQILCYALLKILLKEVIDKESTKDLLCSYFMKTCLFWVIEETNNDENIWNVQNLFHCYRLCLDKLIHWVQTCNCPNYFVPGCNMFRGRIYQDNKDSLLSLLNSFKVGGYQGFCRSESLKSFWKSLRPISDAEREANLEFFCFRVVHVYPFDSMRLLSTALDVTDTLYNSESNQFVIGVINKVRASLHIEYAQMLKVTDDEKESAKVRLQLKNHLLNGSTADACSGLVLMASYYYTLGCHYTALEIVNAAIQKLHPNLVLLRKPEYTEYEKNQYMESVCGRGCTFEQKLKTSTLCMIVLLDHSAVVPFEFQIEVSGIRPLFQISPAALAYSLKFLCFHHLKDEASKHKALKHLEEIVLSKSFILERDHSYALTLLGACYEISEDFSSARKFYTMAINSQPVCKSARIRLDRLDKTKRV